jgi:chromosome segregation ATPase
MSEEQGIENLKASCDSYREQLSHADEALREADKQNAALKAEVGALRAADARTNRLLDIIDRLTIAAWRQG